ncbi:MAG TPA: hypothetical protein DCR90_05115 [Fusobacteriaceae bacterium]|nr:hypothetical protein [Fusobacteriaceae bacterium]
MESKLEKIKKLKKEKNIVILAHYYVDEEIQKIADYIGDSFYLSKIAKNLKEKKIVFCGVSFMGESAKILSPEKKIFIPEIKASCPMANMVDLYEIKKMREKYEDLAVVCYINSTAETKALVDVCVTSSNAETIIKSLPNKNIYFIPDKNLGTYLSKKILDKNFIFNKGYCIVHASVEKEQVLYMKKKYPLAKFLAHPECEYEILKLADYIGSTSGIIDFAINSPCQEFIIGTESGILHKLKEQTSNKFFYSVKEDFSCKNMKKITVNKLLDVLENENTEIKLPNEIIEKASSSLEKMLELGEMNKFKEDYDLIVVGTGVGGCYSVLNSNKEKKILMITKAKLEESDSYLAQGGICVLKDNKDYESFFEDTMKAGHYENNEKSVEEMIKNSTKIIEDLIGYGVDFEKKDGELKYTMEGAHSKARILYHKDITGEEITKKLLEKVKKKENTLILEDTTLIDIISKNNICYGAILKDNRGEIHRVYSKNVILACGGIGGNFENSTNYQHLTGDGIKISKKNNIKLKNLDYIQIHPTTLYSNKKGRRFLISESIRGEGAILYNKNKKRFVNELMPRDYVTKKILDQMEKDNSDHVWLDMRPIKKRGIDLEKRFPNILKRCRKEGYDPNKELIPIVPAQHYFMGGIEVDLNSKTSMKNLYAVGETSCNNVHGANRLASNSLLETLVFSKNAIKDIEKNIKKEGMIK